MTYGLYYLKKIAMSNSQFLPTLLTKLGDLALILLTVDLYYSSIKIKLSI